MDRTRRIKASRTDILGTDMLARIGVVSLTVVLALTAPGGHAATLVHGATDLGRSADDEAVAFEVALPSRDPAGLDRLLAAQQDRTSPRYHQWLTGSEYEARFGPDPATAQRVRSDLQAAGFSVTVQPTGLHAEGRAADANRLFAVNLHDLATAQESRRPGTADPLNMPQGWTTLGARVVAFDPFVRVHALARHASSDPQNRDSTIGDYWFDDLKQAYKAPSYQNLKGAGRTIAILIDADFQDSDMQSYFEHEKLTPPSVTRISVDGGAGFSANGDSFETTLDIQQAFGMAPGARILLYITPDLSDDSLMAGLNRIISDGEADIVSMSIGGCERTYSKAYNGGQSQMATLDQYHQIFQAGNAKGMTFVAASGDGGALQCPPASYFDGGPGPYVFRDGVSTPASDTAVTAVGGTNLLTNYAPPSLDSTYVLENAVADPQTPYDPDMMKSNVSGGYFGSGGGGSIHFRAPSWQAPVAPGAFMRETPDLSLHMGGCPDGSVTPCKHNRSGDYIWFNGSEQVAVGTSASTPGFAGVLALMEQRQGGGRLGNVNPMIYQLAEAQAAGGLRYFHQTIKGYNGLYYSYADGSAPFNMVVGNGTLNIHHFIGAATLPIAGIPQTSSNP